MMIKTAIILLKNTFIGVFLFIVSSITAQQNQLITGNVSDVNNTPIPGVNISEKINPLNGVISDFDGNFSINVKPNSVLIFSYIGYETQEIIIKTKTNLNIILKEDLFSLDEVTLVAYGKQKNRVLLQL